eukprot:19584_1
MANQSSAKVTAELDDSKEALLSPIPNQIADSGISEEVEVKNQNEDDVIETDLVSIVPELMRVQRKTKEVGDEEIFERLPYINAKRNVRNSERYKCYWSCNGNN